MVGLPASRPFPGEQQSGPKGGRLAETPAHSFYACARVRRLRATTNAPAPVSATPSPAPAPIRALTQSRPPPVEVTVTVAAGTKPVEPGSRKFLSEAGITT